MASSHWVDCERMFDKVVALDDDAIHVANPAAAKAAEMKQALDAGEAAAMVVKGDAEVIALESILKVSYNRHDHDIDIVYKPGKEKEDKNLIFSEREDRDAFAAQLAERLSGFESKVVEYGRVRAALSPLAFGTFVAFFTWVFHMAAMDIVAGAEAEFSGRNAGIKRLLFWLIDLIGPTGVLIAGGLVLALTTAALVLRLKTPPIMHTLKRAKS